MKKIILLILLSLSYTTFASDDSILHRENIGYWVSIEQTQTKTLVRYKWKIVQSFIHTENITWLLDEWCVALSAKKLGEKIRTPGYVEQVWEKFTQKEKDDCIWEYVRKAIHVESIWGTKKLIVLTKSGYEWHESWLISIKNGNIQPIWNSFISGIQVGKSGTYIQTYEDRSNCSGAIYLFNNQNKFIEQFSICALIKPSDTSSLESFELLPNKKIKATYILNSEYKSATISVKQN